MPGAGSHEVATHGSDRVSSLVEYERRLNSWYGEGQHKSIDTIERSCYNGRLKMVQGSLESNFTPRAERQPNAGYGI